jgi:aminopeptidase N
VAPALLLAVVQSGCGGGTSLPLDEGVPRELARHRAATISELRYDVALEIPAERTEPISGRSTVTFLWDDPAGEPIVLDFREPEERVREVRVNGEPARWEAVADHIVLPTAGVESGEVVVELEYTAGDEALNRSDEFLYTLFVPDRARFSIPVFDQPDLKARVGWDLTIPANWVAVANGPGRETPAFPEDLAGKGIHRELTERVDAEGTRRWRFIQSRPIPTYLMAFAAGRFRMEQARRGKFIMTMYHRETDQEAVDRNRDAIFDLHGTALDWLEAYTDIEYPFQKLDFVLLPPFQYGGMEHTGSIFYRQSSLMLDESATQGNYLGRASLIAHEVAHMWFGDLVTMQWFDDVWTKEVFANFMAAKIVEPSFPEVDHGLRFLTAHHPAAYGVDRTPGANAIRQPLENLDQAGTLYGAIIYQKAPIVMAKLERTVGEEGLRDGLRVYLERYAYGNATWPDLIAILDERSERDLTTWSQVWVEEPGRPSILLSWEAEAGGPESGRDARVGAESSAESRLTLRQEDPWGRGRVWPQEVEVLYPAGDGALGRVAAALEEDEVRLPAMEGEPEWLLPMASGLEYGLFELPDRQLNGLLASVHTLPEPLHRGAAWILLQDAMLEGQLRPERLLASALEGLEREENEILLNRLMGLVGGVYWRLLTDDARLATAPEVESAFSRGMEGAASSTLRASYFRAWTRVATTPSAIDRMRRIWAGEETVPGVPLSESQEIGLAEALALRDVPDAEEILEAQAARIENPDRLERFTFVRPSLSSDPRVRETFFASLAEDGNRDREPWVLAGLGNLQHPLRREHGASMVPAGLELVEELQATGDIFFPGRWLDTLLGNHNDPAVWGEVETFLRERPEYPPRLRGKVLQAGDGVRRAARVVHGPDAAPDWSPWP